MASIRHVLSENSIPGDAANKWKQDQAEVRPANDRIYIVFGWILERAEGSLTHSAKAQQGWLESNMRRCCD
jgi:hypothetical protein